MTRDVAPLEQQAQAHGAPPPLRYEGVGVDEEKENGLGRGAAAMGVSMSRNRERRDVLADVQDWDKPWRRESRTLMSSFSLCGRFFHVFLPLLLRLSKSPGNREPFHMRTARMVSVQKLFKIEGERGIGQLSSEAVQMPRVVFCLSSNLSTRPLRPVRPRRRFHLVCRLAYDTLNLLQPRFGIMRPPAECRRELLLLIRLCLFLKLCCHVELGRSQSPSNSWKSLALGIPFSLLKCKSAQRLISADQAPVKWSPSINLRSLEPYS